MYFLHLAVLLLCEGVLTQVTENGVACNADLGLVYNSCGSLCPPSCHPPNPIGCDKSCHPGCYCKEGLVEFINDKGVKTCVRKENCPPETTCDGTQGFEYQKCGPSCPDRCGIQIQRPCIPGCFPGCFCKTGLVLSEVDGVNTCVSRDKCPPQVSQQQCDAAKGLEATSCAPCFPTTCEPPRTDLACALVCKDGCTCKQGTVLQNGACINPEKCECDAKKGLVFAKCLPCFPLTCDQPITDRLCKMKCTPGCTCNEGLVLHKGSCIPLEKCPEKECLEPNMQFYGCGPCNGTCAIKTPPCPRICRVGGGCGCKSGYVLDQVGGKCILVSQCPK